jgi:hypothetical protein
VYCGEAGIKSVDVYCGEAGGYAGGEVGGVVVLVLVLVVLVLVVLVLVVLVLVVLVLVVLVLVCSGYSGTPKSSMGARQIGQMGFTLCQFPTHLEWNR